MTTEQTRSKLTVGISGALVFAILITGAQVLVRTGQAMERMAQVERALDSTVTLPEYRAELRAIDQRLARMERQLEVMAAVRD